MTETAIAAEVHQALDVHAGVATQVAFDHVIAVDHFANLQHFLVGELRHPTLGGDLDLLDDLGGVLLADAMDVLKRDQHALVSRNIHAGNTGHRLLSCRRHADRHFSCWQAVSANANTTPVPRLSQGRASLENYPTGYGLIKGLSFVSSTVPTP